MEQTDSTTTYREAETIIKAKQHSRWLQQHPNFNETDDYRRLTGPEQVVHLPTTLCHNRMNHHLYTKSGIGQSMHATLAA